MVTPTGIVPGSRIGGKYEVVEVLGYGGMGVVYKVREQVGAVSRIRALKTVLPRHASNPSIVARFREEAEKMCLLEHDNIVPVLSYSEEGEFPYLVMPFIEGQTLKEYLAAHMAKFGRPLPLSEVVEIALQVTRGLEVAHQFANPETGKLQPIVHRDIKPGNIMVRPEGREGERRLRVLIMDFGIAKLVSDEDTGHTLTDVIGTVKYASPEQVQRSKDIDPRADIYSLGMVLYELYCGRHVFSDLSEHGVLMRMMQREVEDVVPTFPDSTPPEFRELITKCVAAQRTERWPDVASMRTLLRQIGDLEKVRRSDDSRQAEELAMEQRSTAVGTGASEFAASAFGQAERLAEQAKAARDKSLHTEATQLFQAAKTAFEQAADFAAQARSREQLVARIAALRPIREAAAAAGSESLAPTEFAEAVRATEAAERALTANDFATAEREIGAAERGWTNARATVEREAARREAEAACNDVETAIGAESELQTQLPAGIRSTEATKRLTEARAQLQAARVAVRSDDPRRANPALTAARAALDAASGARAAHLERAVGEQADRVAARIRELEPARDISRLAPSLATLEEHVASAERDRAEGRFTEAIERLEEARREAEALGGEVQRTRAAEAAFARARDAAEKARAAAEPFADSAGGKEEFRLGSEAVERAEQTAARDLAEASHEYESAARHFERAQKVASERLRKRVDELRQAAEASAKELRALGDRFSSGGDAKALLGALDRAVRAADQNRLAEAVHALEPLPEKLRASVEAARRISEEESLRKQAEDARSRAERANARVTAIGAAAERDDRTRRGREELRRGTELLEDEKWAEARGVLTSCADRLEAVAEEIATALQAERIRGLTARLERATEALADIRPSTRKLKRDHRAAAAIAESAGSAIGTGDEAAAARAIEELGTAIDRLRSDAVAAASAPPSKAPMIVGGAAVAGVAAAALYFAAPSFRATVEAKPTPMEVAHATKAPRPTSVPTAVLRPTAIIRPTAIPTIAAEPTFAPPPTVPIVVAPTVAPRLPTEAPVIARATQVPPTPLPQLALARAKPDSRALRVPLGGSQKFDASVTGGDEGDLVWRIDERERGRGGSFVLDAKDSAKPGSHKVTLVTRLDGRTETLATWLVEVQAPQLAFASVEPGSSRVERDAGAQIDFEAPVRPSNVDGLSYEWTVNGQRAGGSSGARYRFRPPAPGTYTVAVTASVPWGASIDRSWSLTVNAPKAKPTAVPDVVASRRSSPEDELRQWISIYCTAFERKDTNKLLALGHLKNAAEAERLSEALSVMQNLKLSCTNPSINVDGGTATVSFDRTDRWTDPRGNPVERTLPRITKSLRKDGSGWVVVR